MSDPVTRPAMKLLQAPIFFCRRIERSVPVGEHLACPYCFGDEADVKSGDYQRFCDFRPGVDPVNFGFPKV